MVEKSQPQGGALNSLKEKFQTMLKPAQPTQFQPMNSSRDNDLEGQTITLTDERKGTVKSIGNVPD